MRLMLPDDVEQEEIGSMLLEENERWRDDGVWLVSCRIPDHNLGWGTALERAGFYRVETLLTYARDIPSDLEAHPADVDIAAESDKATCIEIGRTAFRFDRFHADESIADSGADALKAAWVRNGLAGRAHSVFVVREGATVCGFNMCMLRDEIAVIDLIAVAPGHERQGYGATLVAGALAGYAGLATTMRVGTQISNLASLRLYDRAGFNEIGRQQTYHLINRSVQP